MDRREDLHKVLCGLLGTTNVYFQPPSSVSMKYPAIKYSLDDIRKNNANNKMYIKSIRYELIVISKEPNPEVIDKIIELSRCSFDRYYCADNLNHYVFTLYY